eukprot:9488583-Pyramimonas_sp.AAC.1
MQCDAELEAVVINACIPRLPRAFETRIKFTVPVCIEFRRDPTSDGDADMEDAEAAQQCFDAARECVTRLSVGGATREPMGDQGAPAPPKRPADSDAPQPQVVRPPKHAKLQAALAE